jgi:hypothetical protein
MYVSGAANIFTLSDHIGSHSATRAIGIREHGVRAFCAELIHRRIQSWRLGSAIDVLQLEPRSNAVPVVRHT